LGIISAVLDTTGQVLIIYSKYIRHILEREWEYNETVRQLFIDFKKACVSFR